ncbi:hypothetical protein SAMN02787142_7900 [Burkholderia sp. WP9]|nr:hypothetical protein SAMN02787142_7900 [Burkholderia sp. WP9]
MAIDVVSHVKLALPGRLCAENEWASTVRARPASQAGVLGHSHALAAVSMACKPVSSVG